MRHTRQRVELLAPAGNLEAFRGAAAAGADAVYLGGPAYGARAYAENFTEEELVETIREAHIYGIRIYMTTNVLTRQEELPDLVAMVERLDAAGLDGVIVQDIGVLAALHDRCPHLLLHASTQLSVTSAESVRFLRRLGVSRVVPARELSLAEMRQIMDEEEIEIEAFIHGAMCYSYSGRCLMSSLLGGRSGNRGRCAGTCRLPYTVLDPEGRPAGRDGECYPLSMRDLCVLEILPDLIDAGITSFKIEGRMKRPEYAAGTTAIYRKYIDRYYAWDAAGRQTPWRIDPADRRDLLSLYIRAELSTGYYDKRNGRDMLTIGKGGYTGASEELLEEIRQRYLTQRRQVPASGYAYVYAGEPALYSVSTVSPWSGEVIAVSVTGQMVDAAKAHPVTGDALDQRLRKSGDTVFAMADLTVDTDGNSFLPVGQINELRRRALGELQAAVLAEYMDLRSDTSYADTGHAGHAAAGMESREHERLLLEGSLWAVVSSKAQYDAALQSMENGELRVIVIDGVLTNVLYERDWENRLSIPAVRSSGGQILVALPQIMRSGDRTDLNLLYNNCYEKVTGFFVRSLEEIEFLREKDYYGTVAADASLYHWNRSAQDVLLQNVDAAVLPLELSGRELAGTYAGRLSQEILSVYGRIPMMITANCVRKTSGCCRHEENGFYGLLDRKHAVSPVRTDCRHCTNIIYNSVPLSLHRYAGDALHRYAGARLCMFTTEDGGTTRKVLHGYYLLGMDPSSQEGISLITDTLTDGHTSGHYGKGAE